MKNKKGKLFFIGLILLLLCGCSQVGKTDEPQNDKETKQEQSTEETQSTERKKSLQSIEEALHAISEADSLDAIVFLGEGYRFNLPLIQETEREGFYNRVQYKPFHVYLNEEQLTEEIQGTYVLDEPITGLTELKLKFLDGTERLIQVLFLHSYDFAVIPDAGKVTEVMSERGLYNYYRLPMLAFSERFPNMETGWAIFVQDAASEPVTLWNAYAESGSTDSYVNLDYELVGDDRVLSFVFVDRQGIALMQDDKTGFFALHMNPNGFGLLDNTEMLAQYQLTMEDVQRMVEAKIAEGPIDQDGEQAILESINADNPNDLFLFVKNGELYTTLAYTVEGQMKGRFVVSLGPVAN